VTANASQLMGLQVKEGSTPAWQGWLPVGLLPPSKVIEGHRRSQDFHCGCALYCWLGWWWPFFSHRPLQYVTL